MVTVAPAIAAPLGSVIRPATLSAGVGYLHLTGRQIIMSRNLNVPTLTAAEAAAIGDPNLGRPDPRFANNGQFESIGRSQYDGMTISLNGQRGLWGTVRLSYTFSKALDDAGNAFFSTPQDNFDVEDDGAAPTTISGIGWC